MWTMIKTLQDFVDSSFKLKLRQICKKREMLWTQVSLKIMDKKLSTHACGYNCACLNTWVIKCSIWKKKLRISFKKSIKSNKIKEQIDPKIKSKQLHDLFKIDQHFVKGSFSKKLTTYLKTGVKWCVYLQGWRHLCSWKMIKTS